MKSLIFVTLMCLLCTLQAFSQNITVTGTVTDDSGEPLPGVNVIVKGTTIGNSTDANGRYVIVVPDKDVTLVFSYIGFISVETEVAARTNINIQLREDFRQIEEVVVVAYGTQKKASLTGAVSTIAAEKLENRPIANLSSSLSGLAAGVTVRQSSGNPGSDGASILIRGPGTFNSGNRSPMIIIDGSVGSMDSVNPDDVESISILKDAASAAIYGSRAANGVVLVTTKKGKPEATPGMTYSGIFSSEQPSNMYRFITDYATYMELFNRAQVNVGTTLLRYQQATIDAWREAAKKPDSVDNEWGIPNRLAYPNSDWTEALFTHRMYQKHNVSATGGSKNSNYLLSLGYMDNPGTMDNTGLKRYQFRVNLETKIAGFLTVGTQTYAMKQDKQPGNTGSAFTYMFQTVPGMTPVYDGKFGFPEAAEEDATANNMLWFLHNTGGKTIMTRVNTTWYAHAKIINGLTASGFFNYQDSRSDSERWSQSNDMYSFRSNTVKRYGTTLDVATVSYDGSRSYNYTARVMLNYEKSFGEHDINVTLGYEQYYTNTKGVNAQRHGLMDFSITDITTATEMDAISGVSSDYGAQYDVAMVSNFGRLIYSFKNKYLFESTFRRDGSSRFSPENRWGVFPSFSAGWRISEESFMQGLKYIMSNMKLRASWGKLGNTTSGYYDWQAVYGKVNTSFGGTILNGLAQSKVANPLLQWEKVSDMGAGLDMSFLNSRLALELDYYNRLTEGILTSPAIYMTMGTVGAPTKNTSDMRNKGYEIKVDWNDRIGKVRYGISANFSGNSNRIVKYLGKLEEGWVQRDGAPAYESNIGDAASISGNTIRTEGYMIDEYFMRTRYTGTGAYKDAGGNVDPNGGPRDGMIRTPADLQWVRDMQEAGYRFAQNTVGKTALWYGEYIMADVNGDKIYGNTYDRIFLGKSATPKYNFGLGVSLAWKGFDFNMQWAGNAGMYYFMNTRGVDNSTVGSREVLPVDAKTKFYYFNEDDPNDPDNNLNAPYPRLKSSGGAHYDTDRYLYNASYFKLKFMQLGYSLPRQWTQMIYISSLRVFFSGENLATITQFPGVDPEMGSGINVYPSARQLSLGLNVNF